MSQNSKLKNNFLILGAGGHARVVGSILLANNENILGFVDPIYHDNTKITIFGKPLIGNDSYLNTMKHYTINCALGIGDNYKRQELFAKINKVQFLPAIVHPCAQIDNFVSVDDGSIIANGAIISVDAKIGKGVIVNTGAIIDHECEIGDFSHISVGTRIAGKVTIGAFCFIGIGASIIDGIKIGKNSIIGAGSVVLEDVPENVLIAGVPAKIIKLLPIKDE